MLQPIKYRIHARCSIVDPVERRRRLALLYSIFAKPKTVKAEAKPEREGKSDEN